ncbi:DNA alkylation repair protein [Staphylococcus sciuri]|uniref:DNA alkylation repair protein n=1 Tax=Mammaliicoccus sciuri TaxID=1296 RepID=UPI0018C90C69|nr:DNA alkylation repair protein [Mammaliicoccus sciuri]MBG9206833.1 DNA alkylation repair protein [Mammaliicoccus sciuri]
MGQYIPLKYYFDKDLAERLATLISINYKSFPNKIFIDNVSKRVENKELKARVLVIAEELHKALPKEFDKALLVLFSVLGPVNQTEKGMFTNGYFLMPIARYVELYGSSHVSLSLEALYEITQRHTSEYAIRPFIVNNTNECLKYFDIWRKDNNSHVRRLVSEGTRPRLPWASKIDYINGDINQNLVLLDSLKNDSSNYVRKSVGNHLNDLSKEEPEIVLSWLLERRTTTSPIVIKRGLRTLVKKEYPGALEMIREI